ncbi:MAG: hypothetical protein MZU91_06475 [Desulfosudis oleivorans]|nr:hypothetical protein [Desulfosudis oleivorans]
MDAFGLLEPEIVVQGDNRVRLQLPGVTDPTRIKKNIMRTAKLEFILVDEIGSTKAAAEQANNGQPPPSMALVAHLTPETRTTRWNATSPAPASSRPGRRRTASASCPTPRSRTRPTPRIRLPLLPAGKASVSGADLKDARPGYDTQNMQGSVVNFQFNMKGAQRFAKLTGDHIGELLAVVLENQVASALRINDKIFERGQISGSFTQQQATDLANVLRSGALDVNIKIEEERTVGASLGADSIREGPQRDALTDRSRS